MSKKNIAGIFNKMGGDTYDQVNHHFRTIYSNLHFLNILILKDLPENARILCVGVGTGADIIDLAATYKNWSFVGIDPAASMLTKCRKKLNEKNLLDRCELIEGYLSDYNFEQPFDAVLCLHVMHFIEKKEETYSQINRNLKEGGYLINAEISLDFSSSTYPDLLENWKALHGLSGANKEMLNNMPNILEKQLAVISPKDTSQVLKKSGFKNPVPFFQSFLIRGWYAKKD